MRKSSKESEMTERYLVPSYGPDKKKLGTAVLAGVGLAKKHSCKITLLVPTISNAKNTILKDVLGEAFVKNLVKGKIGSIEGIPVRLRSIRTINPYQEGGVIISFWGGKKALSKTNDAYRAKAVVILPWKSEDVEQWQAEWSPKIIDGIS